MLDINHEKLAISTALQTALAECKARIEAATFNVSQQREAAEAREFLEVIGRALMSLDFRTVVELQLVEAGHELQLLDCAVIHIPIQIL